MMTTNNGGPAFPTQTYDRDAAFNGFSVTVTDEPGMSKREYYAAMALQGINAGYWSNPDMSGQSPHDRADEAVQCADALIAILDAREVQP
jgi:hypothetical protein